MSVTASQKALLERALLRVHAGEGSFEEFLFLTGDQWDSLAAYAYRRWRRRIPSGITVDDFRQEMLVEVFRSIEQWREGAGPSIRTFVVWRALKRALRFVNVQRCAARRSVHAESRHPLLSSDVEGVQPDLAVEPDQEVTVFRLVETRRMVGQCPTLQQKAALLAVVNSHGSVDLAAEALLGTEEVRLLSGVRTMRGARRLICRTLIGVVGVSVSDVHSQADTEDDRHDDDQEHPREQAPDHDVLQPAVREDECRRPGAARQLAALARLAGVGGPAS